MLKENKNIIIFQTAALDKPEFYDDLLKNGWNIHTANNIPQISDLLEKHVFHAGLCLVNRCILKSCFNTDCMHTDHCTTLNRLFNLDSNINWLMAVPKEATPTLNPNSIESQLIIEYCFDYITLPIDINRLIFSLEHAIRINQLTRPYKSQTNENSLIFGIIGNSKVMVNLFRQLHKVSKEDCPVLIQGETGTGKELIANAVHNFSKRSKHPLVTINCGAIPTDLIQSELFGHEKGAFTGAQQLKIGRIESAHGGTLFLDEIGDLPFEQQVNLLRFLENRTIQRVGGAETIPVDVRVIAATHINLKEAVLKRQFREDLYYRLQVLCLETPALRDRDGDIEALAWYFFNKFSADNSYKAKGFQVDTLKLMCSYNWPGNIRELMNRVRHAIVMSENVMLSPEDLGMERNIKYRKLQTIEEARAIADREVISSTLQSTSNNISRAAESMGISRVSLYRLMDKHGIMSS